jgi:hypothetical protein
MRENNLHWSLVLLFVAGGSWVSAWEPSSDICTIDSHCLNGGNCMPANEVTSFKHCHCKDGFSGPRCSRFCPYDCMNGGYCTVTPQGDAIGLQEQTPTYDPEDYMCKCFGHFTGKLCDIPYTNCGDEERCYHGGQCLLGEDMKHKCSCPGGFTGDSCETTVQGLQGEKMTEQGRKTMLVSSILVVILGAGLVLIVQRQRSKPPKFIVVKGQEEEDYQYDHRYPRSVRYHNRPQTSGGVILNVL